MTKPQIVDDFKVLFNELNKSNINRVDLVYDREIHFIDPLHELKDLESYKRYLADLYENTTSCSFDFTEEMIQGDSAFLVWTMRVEHKKLSRPATVPGISHIRFNEKITFHQDFFDVGAMLYENIPVLGPLVRMVKSHATKSSRQ